MTSLAVGKSAIDHGVESIANSPKSSSSSSSSDSKSPSLEHTRTGSNMTFDTLSTRLSHSHNTTERDATTTTTTPPLHLPNWYPKNCRGEPVFYGNPEALGWALDQLGRSVAFIAAGAFLGSALLRLAKQEVGCPTDPPEGSNTVPECHERVYGVFRPSSLLTTYTIVVGVASAIFLPVMGAIVDFTPHRRLVGRWLSVGVCALQFPQIFLSDRTWFPIALLQIGVAFVGWAQTTVTHAYLPELSDNPERVSVYTQSFTIVSFGSMVLFLVAVIALAAIFDLGDVSTARLGMAAAFGVSAVTLFPAWAHLLQKRPATHELPTGRSLWTAGFVQVWKSSVYIYRNWFALKWFYISVALIDGAVGSLGTIMITYMTDTLNFSSSENGIAILLMLVGSIPGALIAGKTTHRWNPFVSSIVATLVMGLNGIAAAIVLKEPGQQLETYVLAFIWGAGTGWKWTVDRYILSTILPNTGQDAELMGLYLFFGQSLTWLPPLVFTIINEIGLDKRFGLGSVSSFFFIGAVAIVMMGDYHAAVSLAGRVMEPIQEEGGDEEEPSESGVVVEAAGSIVEDPAKTREESTVPQELPCP